MCQQTQTSIRSILHLEFPSSKVQTHFQQKRIKAVDLLSKLYEQSPRPK